MPEAFESQPMFAVSQSDTLSTKFIAEESGTLPDRLELLRRNILAGNYEVDAARLADALLRKVEHPDKTPT